MFSMSIAANGGQDSFFFFLNDTAPTEIYTLPLHDALPISERTGDLRHETAELVFRHRPNLHFNARPLELVVARSEEHTSELQSRLHLVCRLLLEKKKKHIALSPKSLLSNRVPTMTRRSIMH